MIGSLEWYLTLIGSFTVIVYISFWLYSLVGYQSVFEKRELIRSWIYFCGTSLVLISAGILKLTHVWGFENFILSATLYPMFGFAIWANFYYLDIKGGCGIVFYPIHPTREYSGQAQSSDKFDKSTIFILLVLAVVFIVIPIIHWGYLIYISLVIFSF